jgi:hypothetical protein
MDYRFISTLMWFLNVVLPVIMGSYYVLNYKAHYRMVEIKINALSICLRFLSSILIIYCITIAWLMVLQK